MSDAANKILEEYEKIRQVKEYEKGKRVENIYEEYPQIKDIDRKIYLTGAENVKNIIKSPDNADKLNKEYKEELKKLNDERKKIIEENNIDPCFDKIKYECEKCKDTGYTDDFKKCSCFEKKLIKYRYEKANLSDILEKENFETFSLNYYTDRKLKGYELSPRDNMKMIYLRAVKFCENFDNEEKGLLFYGSTGLGKTFLSNCIAKKLIDEGKTVIYLRASKIFTICEDYRFRRLEDEDIMNDIFSSDLLIIDDLGTEPQNKNNLSFLFDIINDRLEREKKIIINTNYNMNELTKIYSSRMTSRIYEYFMVYGFYGDDIRIQKLMK